jgi:alkylated DNA nucleotide flippase Atl1
MGSDKAVIEFLALKKTKGEPMSPQSNLVLRRGLGIEGDANANAISPRQVLITRLEDLHELGIPLGGLRENIIVSGIDSAKFQPGATLLIGTASIRLTFHCEPCKRIAGVVPSMNAILGRRGVLGVVLEAGEIHLDDPFTLLSNSFEPFSEVPYERFLMFVKHLPYGKVVNYKMVTIGMGVAESYIRAIPKYIERTNPEDYPIHRIVDTEGALIEKYVANQRSKLSEEGVTIFSDSDLFQSEGSAFINFRDCLWAGESLFLT